MKKSIVDQLASNPFLHCINKTQNLKPWTMVQVRTTKSVTKYQAASSMFTNQSVHAVIGTI